MAEELPGEGPATSHTRNIAWVIPLAITCFGTLGALGAIVEWRRGPFWAGLAIAVCGAIWLRFLAQREAQAAKLLLARRGVSLGDVDSWQLDLAAIGNAAIPAGFNPRDPALVKAWEGNDAETVADCLTHGNTLNQHALTAGEELFRKASRHVDMLRSVLYADLTDYAATLSARGIGHTPMQPVRGRMPDVTVAAVAAKYKVPLDIGQGTGRVLGQVMAGNGSWQLGLATIAMGLLVNKIHHSRALRRLKEAEGQIAAQGAAIAGVVTNLRASIATRLIPQGEGLVKAIAELRRVHAALGAGTVLTPADAARFAMTLAEGQKLLQMTAGD